MSESREYAALASGALLIDRSDRVRIRFGGPRAAELVTGLVTNDVLSLTPGTGQYAAALTPKGKIAADLRIFADAEGLLTDTSPRAGSAWRDIVKKYVNPRVAPYRDVTAETRCVGVYGHDSMKVVAGSLGIPVDSLAHLAPYSHVPGDIGEGGARAMVVRVAEIGHDGFEIFIPISAEAALRSRMLATGAIPGSEGTWDLARIEAGRPEWGIDMNDSTIVQEANLDELGAISYTKGCYTGQETVARVHFRGHVNRFLRRLRFAGKVIPPAGSELVDGSGNVVGDIRSVAVSPRLGGIAIAMVRREVQPGAELRARWEGGECAVEVADNEKGATG